MKTALIALVSALTVNICSALNLSKDEKILNGGFESGIADYTTDYIFTNLYLHIEGYYTITRNPKLSYTSFADCRDHTSGTGMMAVFNGSEKPGAIVWQQKVNKIEHNRMYYFSFWATSVILNSPARLEIYVNGIPLNLQPVILPDELCQWIEYGFYWSSGLSDTALITIKNANTDFFGNDFAIDDLSLRAVCIEGEVAGPDKVICYGESAGIGMENPPQDSGLIWKWTPPSDLSADNIPNPIFTGSSSTKYYLEVADPGINCFTYDTVQITVAPELPGTISTDKSGIVCPCDSIKLQAPSGEFTYLWSTGETNSSIMVKNSGRYSVSLQNSYGCQRTIDTTIEIFNSIINLALDSVVVNTGESAIVNLRITNEINKNLCVPPEYKIMLRFDKSSLTPLDNKYPLTENGDYSVMEITGGNFDNLLQSLRFTLSLGIVPNVPIEITSADFGCSDIKITASNGIVEIRNLCIKPTPRLFKDTDELYLKLLSPNPAVDILVLEFSAIEKGFAEVVILDALGRQVYSTGQSQVSVGVYNCNINLSSFAGGIYYSILKTPTINTALKFIILK